MKSFDLLTVAVGTPKVEYVFSFRIYSTPNKTGWRYLGIGRRALDMFGYTAFIFEKYKRDW